MLVCDAFIPECLFRRTLLPHNWLNGVGYTLNAVSPVRRRSYARRRGCRTDAQDSYRTAFIADRQVAIMSAVYVQLSVVCWSLSVAITATCTESTVADDTGHPREVNWSFSFARRLVDNHAITLLGIPYTESLCRVPVICNIVVPSRMYLKIL